VGAEPFNAQEMQTINNNNTSLVLQRLDVRVYEFDRFACLNQHCLLFCFASERAPSLKKNN